MMTQPAFIPRCPIESSLIASVGYCPLSCTLDIELRDGSLYRYFGVPFYVCWNLLCANSKGSYFNRYVKAAFAYQRLSPPRPSVGAAPSRRSRSGQAGLRRSDNHCWTAQLRHSQEAGA
jgi:hypothetical protein